MADQKEAEEKKALHLVLATMLERAHQRIVEKGELYDLLVAATILQALRSGKMPPADARQIAKDREDLPALLAMVYGATHADLATVALADLARRQDEPKKGDEEKKGTVVAYTDC